MISPAANRDRLIELANATLEAFYGRQFTQAFAELVSADGAELDSARCDVLCDALSSALEWERLDRRVQGEPGGTESPAAVTAEPFIPNNQVLSLLQSAYDEYLEAQQPGKDLLEVPFDTEDPGWLTIAFQKLASIFRGKHAFKTHTNAESFLISLPDDAVVALFSDWGTAEPTAQRVMDQIRLHEPTHAIHLGDVYYSGTPREAQKRFIEIVQQRGPSMSSCRYFSLNANHDMYSGGYGYFDSILPKCGQEASYFNLRNQHWQLIGIDSGYEDFGLRDPQKEWLATQLNRKGPKSILLSHHQLFSPYESGVQNRTLHRKISNLLPLIFAWFWGHEHKNMIMGGHLGIKARCIGHGAIPTSVPYGNPAIPEIPIVRVDERPSPDGTNIHGFALLQFSGPRLDVSYIDEFSAEFFSERLDKAASVVVPHVEHVSLSAQGLERGFDAHYKRQLMTGKLLGGSPSADSGTESLGGLEAAHTMPDLSRAAIEERVKGAAAELHEVVKKHLGDRPDLHEIVDQIVSQGRDSLEVLGREGNEGQDSEFVTAGLEVIVRTDGSRPSFMVRDGIVDLTTSPVGAWGDQVTASIASGLLTAALACVGRIDLPGSSQGFAGTGFLIHDNLIVTNRHVLQAIAQPDMSGTWIFKPGAAIDFGHEFRARDSVSPRALKRVVFCPPRTIDISLIDHSKLDLVIIELETAKGRDKPGSVLAFDLAADWAVPGQFIYTVGYPGNPGLAEPLSLLEQLFQSTFGCKRLAPGEIQTANSAVFSWTLAHDGTTLGGNSGSVVLTAGREGAAAGLHYGGTRQAPRENWGHVLGRVLDQGDKVSGKSLRECLDSFGVQLVDRRSS